MHKSFGSRNVLGGINLGVNSGELLAVVGSSGSGKSTLLRHLTGHFRPDRGRVLMADHESAGSPLVDLATLDEDELERLERHWGVVFQQNGLLGGSVLDNIALPLRVVQGLSEQVIRTRVELVMRAVGLDWQHDAQLQSDQLSGGMSKRVAIARALAIDPVLLLYDEPTTGLDPAHSYEIQDLIAAAHSRRTGEGWIRTSILVTHDKDLLSRMQPRIVMLQAGLIAFAGTFESFEHSNLPAIQPYIASMPALQRGRIP